jgi:actin-related protein 8
VALNLYDFDVRQPNKPTEKYGLRAYDEIILAPMVCNSQSSIQAAQLVTEFQFKCLFEPRVIEFDKKLAGMRPISHPDISDDILEPTSDQVVSLLSAWVFFAYMSKQTQAMIISTQHLLPQEPAPMAKNEPAPDSAEEPGATHVSTPANEPSTTTHNGSASASEIAAPSKQQY